MGFFIDNEINVVSETDDEVYVWTDNGFVKLEGEQDDADNSDEK